MNTHDKIKLPPHDVTANLGGSPPIKLYSEAKVRAAIMDAITDVWDRAKQIDDAADEVLDLIKADRKQRHLKEQAQLNQEWAALKDMQAQYDAYRKRRGEPVGIVKRPSESHYPGVQWIGDVRDGEHLYASPQPAEPAMAGDELTSAASALSKVFWATPLDYDKLHAVVMRIDQARKRVQPASGEDTTCKYDKVVDRK